MKHAKLLDLIYNEKRAHEIAQEKYANQLAPFFSVFDYINTNEVMLSQIIADLLNPKAKHGQGDLFLCAFLKQLANPNIEQRCDL